MKVMFIHAHFDDYEFTAAGLFELWRRKLGHQIQRQVLVCTDGKAGHHFRSREETGRLRLLEQQESARIGGYDFQLLRLPNGQVPREACLQVTTDLLAALWKAVRDFAPDYLFCPPIPSNPLVGIHVDHVALGEAVRQVAYMINVPHAFTPEYPANEAESTPCKTPIIINVYDPYTVGTNSHDLSFDVEEVFPLICHMSWCHQSQIAEWLPWVGRHALEKPGDLEDWQRILRRRFARKNADVGIQSERPMEVFTVTGWGAVPTLERLLSDLPRIDESASRLEQLRSKLQQLGTL